MKRYELRLALIRTVVGVIAAMFGIISAIIAGIHLWLFMTYLP